MGCLSLRIIGYDLIVRGQREIKLFQQLIDKADNFEIYTYDKDKIKFNIMFRRVFERIE